MPIRDAYLHIRVFDETNARRTPGANDQVKVDGAALSHDPAKGFVYKLNGKKDITVDIAFRGFADLRQWFEMEAPAERPKLTPFWPGSDADCERTGSKRKGYLLGCMAPLREAGGAVADRSPTVFAYDVKLEPTREYVAVIGTNYWEGAYTPGAAPHRSSLDFVSPAVTFAQHLFVRGLINSSSPFTMLDCQRGVIEQWMRLFAKKAKPWRRHSIVKRKSTAPAWKKFDDFKEWLENIRKPVTDPDRVDPASYLGATDIYGYLHGMGGGRRGTVIEFSVFSHSFMDGPVLFNTASSRTRTRDTADLDLRSYQDFVSPNITGWSKLKDAFATGANIHIWGCLATDVAFQMIYWLHQKPGAGDYFDYNSKIDQRRYHRSRAEVFQDLQNRVDDPDLNYMKAIARYTGSTGWGGPPGFGSSFSPYSNLKAIPAGLRNAVGAAEIMEIRATRPGVYPRRIYESSELGSRKFNWFGHMKYVA